MYLVTLCLLLSAMANEIEFDRQIFLLYNTSSQIEGTRFDSDLPEVKRMNCAVKQCLQFRPQSYPALFAWGGPGTSYRKIEPTSNEGLRTYLQNWVNHPLHPLRVYIASLSIPGTILLTLLLNIPIYFIFSIIFRNRNKPYQKVDTKQE